MASEGSNHQEPTPGAAGGEPREGKRFFKFAFTVNRKCSDETEMTAEFLADVKHYHEYDDAVEKCHQYLDNIIEPCCTRGNKEEDEAYNRLSIALADFRSHVPSSHSAAIENFARQMRGASISRKKHQQAQTAALNHLKKFHTEDFARFSAQKKLFDESRRKMDVAKAEVREAKTTTAIEKKAICYQMAVDDFDQQTESLIKIIDALPAAKRIYGHDIIIVIQKHKAFHQDMCKFFAMRE